MAILDVFRSKETVAKRKQTKTRTKRMGLTAGETKFGKGRADAAAATQKAATKKRAKVVKAAKKNK